MNRSDLQETPQMPLNSGFGHDSTAASVLEDMDLSGCAAIVTGGYSGLGLETVRALVGAGVEVSVPARRADHARGYSRMRNWAMLRCLRWIWARRRV
ncbi:hypothetical protein NHF46_16695 [Arthrobacter alpinus]|nr:hypothetical protein [Arthrobacter alpinus]